MNLWSKIQDWKPISYFSKGKRWLILLLCILLATILWLLQALNSTYTKRVRMVVEAPTLPLRYDIDHPEGIPEAIEIAITARGDKLMSYTLQELFSKTPILKLAIDTLQITKEGGYISINRDELIRQIRNTNDLFNAHFGANSDVQVSLYPDFVSFSYAPLVERRLEVFFGSQIDLGEESNRMLISLEMEPDEVTVYGVATAIDSLIANQGLIGTDPRPLKITSDSVSYHKVSLVAPRGIRLTPDSVTIKTVVEPLKYNTFVINNIGIRNLPNGYKIRLFPSMVKVTFLALNNVSVSEIINQIHPYVDIDELEEGIKKLKIRLNNVPSEVQMIQLEPDMVEYLIEQE